MFDEYFWAEWRRTPSSYDEAPPLAAWLVVGALVALGARTLVVERLHAGALWHPAVVLAVLGAVALISGWVRDGAGQLCLLVGLDVIAAIGASFHVAAWGASGEVGGAAERWLSCAVAVQLLPGVWLHLRTWTMVASDWNMHVWSATHAAEVRAALSAPRGGDGVFVASSVSEGDAVGELRDGEGPRPVVLRVERIAPRFAKVAMDVPAAYLLSGVVVEDERVPGPGYREQETRSRIVSFASSRFLGADPERAAAGTSFLGNVAKALFLLVLQHLALAVAGLVLAAVLAALVDAWT